MNSAQNTSTMLHENEYGNVVLCNCCGDFQLTLGNVMLKMPAKGFQNLQLVLKAMLRDKVIQGRLRSSDQKLIIRTPSDNLFISVTPSEFNGLLDLIENALIMNEVLELVSGK